MELIKAFLIAFIFLSTPNTFAGGNGSSGVGNGRLQILRNISISDLNSSVNIKDNTIYEVKSNKEILNISQLDKSDVDELIKINRLVQSRLGSVDALEYVPDIKNEYESNYWVICNGSMCYKLISATKEGSLAPVIIGTLKKINK